MMTKSERHPAIGYLTIFISVIFSASSSAVEEIDFPTANFVVYGDSRWADNEKDIKSLYKANEFRSHKALVAKIEEIHGFYPLTAVIHLGDMVFQGDNILQWSVFRDEFVNPLSRLGIQTIPVYGNHEFNKQILPYIPGRLDTEEALKIVRSTFPEARYPWFSQTMRNYFIGYHGITFVFLNGELTSADLRHYLSYIGEKNIDPKILFIHRPLVSITDKSLASRLLDRTDLFSSIAEHLDKWRVIASFAGHEHIHSRLSLSLLNTRFFTVGPAGASFKTPISVAQMKSQLRSKLSKTRWKKTSFRIDFEATAVRSFFLLQCYPGKVTIIPYLADRNDTYRELPEKKIELSYSVR